MRSTLAHAVYFRPATSKAVLLAVTVVLAAAGCTDGMRLGARPPLAPSSIQVIRRAGGERADANAIRQRLVIDLANGRATLTDTDGVAHPQQIDPALLENLHAAVASRSWQIGTRSPAKGAADPTHYSLTVYDRGQPMREQAVWAEPPAKPLPESLVLVEQVFERVDRAVHPLGERVDLTR